MTKTKLNIRLGIQKALKFLLMFDVFERETPKRKWCL